MPKVSLCVLQDCVFCLCCVYTYRCRCPYLPRRSLRAAALQSTPPSSSASFLNRQFFIFLVVSGPDQREAEDIDSSFPHGLCQARTTLHPPLSVHIYSQHTLTYTTSRRHEKSGRHTKSFSFASKAEGNAIILPSCLTTALSVTPAVLSQDTSCDSPALAR
jgi:hypothetical protein